jgi:hypothetical protein
MANDSIINALLSIEKRFDEYDATHPSQAPAADPTAVPATPSLVQRATSANHDLDDLSDLGDDSSGDDDDDDDADDDAASSDE